MEPTRRLCPYCNASVDVAGTALGQSLTCPSCGGSFNHGGSTPADRCLRTLTLSEGAVDAAMTRSLEGCPPPPADPWGPGLMERYDLVRRLGQGGMGAVYLARHKALDRLVAVKTVLGLDPHSRVRFAREGRLLASMSHPNILTIHDLGEAGDVPYLVFEYVEGEDLRDLLDRERPVSVNRVVRLADGLLSGLAHAHGHEIVHRDIKPENVLLPGVGGLKVADFGLARSDEGEASATLTQTGVILGTPVYMAPEQARGEMVDAAADVYSAGVVMYEMLAGRPPFAAASIADLLRQHIEEEPADPREHRPEIPEAIAKAVLKALAKVPRERWDGAEEFRQGLAGAAGAREARHPSGSMRAVASPAGGAAGRASPRRWREATARQWAVLVLLTAWFVGTLTGLLPSGLEPSQAASGSGAAVDDEEMVLVSEGVFLMGSFSSDEQRPHRVDLDAFYIDRYEVTNRRYRKFIEATGPRERSYWSDARYNAPDQPVVGVDWHHAVAYCRWAGKRLPTEAEWEKAARGNDGRTYPWGNETPDAGGTYRANWLQWTPPGVNEPDGFRHSAPVGSFPSGASPYGALDMAGNVSEWCADWYDAKYYFRSPARNPQGPPSGTARVCRGGSWLSPADELRCASRPRSDLVTWFGDIGFRCARSSR